MGLKSRRRPMDICSACGQMIPTSYLTRLRLQTRPGVNLTKAANSIGVSKGFLSRLESGGSNPSLKVAVKLSRYYRIQIDELAAGLELGHPGAPNP